MADGSHIENNFLAITQCPIKK